MMMMMMIVMMMMALTAGWCKQEEERAELNSCNDHHKYHQHYHSYHHESWFMIIINIINKTIMIIIIIMTIRMMMIVTLVATTCRALVWCRTVPFSICAAGCLYLITFCLISIILLGHDFHYLRGLHVPVFHFHHSATWLRFPSIFLVRISILQRLYLARISILLLTSRFRAQISDSCCPHSTSRQQFIWRVIHYSIYSIH